MKELPPKLFEMSQQGGNDEYVQFIFDALICAEENQNCFVNVYEDGSEPKFLFTNDLKRADQQLRFWIERTGKSAMGFVNSGATWVERSS
jgi:hypothetical protein